MELAIKVGAGQLVAFRSKDLAMLKDVRLNFYGFRKAVEREGAQKMFPRLNRITSKITSIVGAEGAQWMIEFMPVDTSPLSTFLELQMARETPVEEKALYQPNVHSIDIDEYQPVAKNTRLNSTLAEQVVEELYGPERDKKHKSAGSHLTCKHGTVGFCELCAMIDPGEKK